MKNPKYNWTEFLRIGDRKVKRWDGGVFFRPQALFIDWLIRYADGAQIVECGAGRARIGYELRKKEIKALCLDQELWKDRLADVHQADCTTFDYPQGSVVVIARPARGEWIHETILQALCSARAVLYVGLKLHLRSDIDSLPGGLKAVMVMESAGECDEVVFEITKIGDGEKSFVLLDAGPNKPQWWLDAGVHWLDWKGSRRKKSKNDRPLTFVRCPNFAQLNWRGTSLLDSSSPIGLLDRDGRYFGCGQGVEITELANLVFATSLADLLAKGYVWFSGCTSFKADRRISEAQSRFLAKRGLEADE